MSNNDSNSRLDRIEAILAQVAIATQENRADIKANSKASDFSHPKTKKFWNELQLLRIEPYYALNFVQRHLSTLLISSTSPDSPTS